MSHSLIRRIVTTLLVFALGGAHAFQWTPFEFPPGDQGYTMEIVTEEGVSVVDIGIVATGDELEFAVAENLPVPCFSRYGSGSDAIEARLIDVR